MSLPSLYTLTGQYLELEQLLATDTDLDATALEAINTTLDAREGDIEVKAANVGAYVLNLEAWAVATKDASKKLATRATRIQHRADVMREYIRRSMAALDLKKIEADQFTLARKANPPAVVIDPEAEIPDEYLQPHDPRLFAIKRAIMEDAYPDGDLVIDVPRLMKILDSNWEPRVPDKTKIGEALKPIRKAWQAACELAKKAKQPLPAEPTSPIKGCRLEQGERLEIKP